MEITLNISDEIIESNLVSAFEGGSNYWISEMTRDLKIEQKKIVSYTPVGDEKIHIHDSEKDEVVILTHEKLQKGLKIMSEKYPNHFGDLISENGDADTGDVLLQCALFGDIIYG